MATHLAGLHLSSVCLGLFPLLSLCLHSIVLDFRADGPVVKRVGARVGSVAERVGSRVGQQWDKQWDLMI